MQIAQEIIDRRSEVNRIVLMQKSCKILRALYVTDANLKVNPAVDRKPV